MYNAGWPTFTVVDDLLRWRRDIRGRHPEFLVLFVGGNDIVATERSRLPQRELRALIESLTEPTLGNRLRLAVFDLRLLVGLRSMVSAVKGNQIHRFVPNTSPADFEVTLRELLTEARGDGVAVILAPEIITECLTQPDHALRTNHEILARLAEEFDCRLIDTVAAFRARRLDRLMVDHIHINAEGHRIVSDLLTDEILER